MAYAFGRRLIGGLCFLTGAVTIIGIPVFWPIAWLLLKSAKQAEREREQEIEALKSMAE